MQEKHAKKNRHEFDRKFNDHTQTSSDGHIYKMQKNRVLHKVKSGEKIA